METIIVRRTGERPLKFQGELVYEGGTSLNNASPSYSGATGRAEDAKLYKTAKGSFVVAIHNITQWQGEHDTDEAYVCASKAAAIDCLRSHIPGWLLDDIMDIIGKEDIAEEVE